MTDLAIGGLAAVGAGFFSNPLEVIKIRIQLQGELLKKGKYVKHYKNIFHAGFVIAKNDGIFSLQAGLAPALMYQMVMNGTRLGFYQMADKRGWIKNKKGDVESVSGVKSWFFGALCGCIGAVTGSPFFLIKTQLQSKSVQNIAVGTQHDIKGMISAFTDIFKKQGITGLWRGWQAAVPRVATGSSIQMLTFDTSLEFVTSYNFFPKGSLMNVFIASLYSGVLVALGMAPFDLIATRVYNQSVDSKGKGLLYSSVFDCARKIYQKEGLSAFLKGWTVNYVRIGPHTLLLMMFWNSLKKMQNNYEESKTKKQFINENFKK